MDISGGNEIIEDYLFNGQIYSLIKNKPTWHFFFWKIKKRLREITFTMDFFIKQKVLLPSQKS
jgi:hypothetical protein